MELNPLFYDDDNLLNNFQRSLVYIAAAVVPMANIPLRQRARFAAGVQPRHYSCHCPCRVPGSFSPVSTMTHASASYQYLVYDGKMTSTIDGSRFKRQF